MIKTIETKCVRVSPETHKKILLEKLNGDYKTVDDFLVALLNKK